MPYERLLRTNRIHPYQARSSEIRQLLEVAQRDLSTAEINLAHASDWAYGIAYNAVLQAGRALSV